MGCGSRGEEGGERASAAGGPAAGRGAGKRPGLWPGSGVAVRPCCGTEQGADAGTSPVGLGERGSPAPPVSASSSCSGTRSSPERKKKKNKVRIQNKAESGLSVHVMERGLFALGLVLPEFLTGSACAPSSLSLRRPGICAC